MGFVSKNVAFLFGILSRVNFVMQGILLGI